MHKPLSFVATGALVLLLLTSGNANGITVELEPIKDNTLYQSLSGSLSNGAGPGLFAGLTGQDRIVRGLLMFDIAAEIPETATITGASLSLEATKVFNDSFSETIDLRRVVSDWGEEDSVAVGGNGGGGTGGPAFAGDATWIHRFSPNQFWANQGGDFSSIVSASQGVGGLGSYDWESPQLLADVQDMFDASHNNFGWILLGNESTSDGVKRFGSRESNTPPVLTVEFSVPSNFAADFDGDGDVDSDDLGDWAGDFGDGNGGDADADDDTDGADFFVWQREFTGPAGLQEVAIPEPSSAALSLAVLALAALDGRNGRRRPRIGRK